MDPATRAVYETQADRYERRRTPRLLPDATAFGRRCPPGPVVDLGCGPGWYTTALGATPIALDGALAMVRRARERAPDGPALQADLGALPFRRGALAGGWARNTYVHLRSVDVPMALGDLHRSLQDDAPVEVTFFGRDDGAGELEGRGVFPDDDFPERWFSTWPEARLRDVVLGAGFALDELAVERRGDDVGFVVRARRAPTLPDTVGADMRLLVCGLNPSVHAAEAGIGFVTPGNRFWPAAIDAGLVTRDRDPYHALFAHGIGMTDLVKRATSRADALSPEEYRDGLARVERLCGWLQPAGVCLVGLAGWRAAVDRRAGAGWQTERLGGRRVYVMPSTSGLNAATPLATLIDHLRTASGT